MRVDYQMSAMLLLLLLLSSHDTCVDVLCKH